MANEWEIVSVWAATSKTAAKKEAAMLRNQRKYMNYKFRVIPDPDNSDNILVQRAFREVKLYY